MTNKTNTFEGQTSGTTWTAAGSGGGSWDALDSLITGGSGATGTYDSAQKMHGSLSLAVSGPTTSQWMVAWTLAGGSWSARIYVRITSFTSAQDIAQVRNSGGQASTIGLTSGRAITLKDATGAAIETLATLSLDTWYRLDWWGSKGTTTSNGTTLISIYSGDGTTAVSLSTTGTANKNTGTTDFTQFRVGKLTSASAISMWIDSVSVLDTAAGDLGPFARSGNGSSTLSLASNGVGSKAVAGNGSSTLSLASNGAGAKTGRGSGSSALTLTSTGVGSKRAVGVGSSALTLSSTGVGSKRVGGSGSSLLTVISGGTGWKTAVGSGQCIISVAGGGVGTKTAYGSGSSLLTLTSDGSGSAPVLPDTPPFTVSGVAWSPSPTATATWAATPTVTASWVPSQEIGDVTWS